MPLDFYESIPYLVVVDVGKKPSRCAGGVWFVGLIAVFLVGCDLFQTRSVEPPGGTSSPWIYPNQVEQVFINMQQAMADLNTENYLRCFFAPDDSSGVYLFIPNPNYVGWPLSQPWGYGEESQTIQYLFSLMTPNSPGFLMFEEEANIPYGNEDSVLVTQTYNLSVPVSDPTLPQEVTGRSDFYLKRNSTGYWAIYRWEDLEGSPSWTDLKAGL